MAVSASTTGHQVSRRPAVEAAIQGIEQVCERLDQRLDSWFKTYIYSGAPFSVTDSKIATDVNASGVVTPLADLVVPTAFGMHCNQAIRSARLACQRPILPLTLNRASRPRSRPIGATSSPNSFRGPDYFDLEATCSEASPSRRSISSCSACRLTTCSITRTSPTLGNPYLGRLRRNHQHSGPTYQHLRYGPGRFGFRTSDGSYGHVLVLGRENIGRR